MNWEIMIEVLMSAIFFAPLLIGLTFFVVIGGAMMFEGLASFFKKF